MYILDHDTSPHVENLFSDTCLTRVAEWDARIDGDWLGFRTNADVSL